MIAERNKVISALYNHINKPVIINPQTTNRPPYPFIGYTVTTVSMREDNEYGNIIESDLVQDIKQTLEYNDNMMISFTAYSLNMAEAYNLASKAYEFFKFAGLQTLEDENLVVVDTMNVESRDILEVDAYERRAGFDVRIRFKKEIERVIPTIETFAIEGVVEKPVSPNEQNFFAYSEDIESESSEGYNKGILK